MNAGTQLIAFSDDQRISSGPIAEVLVHLKTRFDRGDPDALCFEVNTGAQVEFDLRGSLEDVLAREVSNRQPTAHEPRGRGRPKLGVSGREVSLLPRHWEWLERQPNGISATLRRVVEQASKADPGRERAERIRAALSCILSAVAGNRPNYEEACRALFAAESERFESLIAPWPQDIRSYAAHHMREAARAVQRTEPEIRSPAQLVRSLYERVWSYGEYEAIEQLIASDYQIHSDPGDAWEHKTLDRAQYTQRVRYSRRAFPDLSFVIEDMIAQENKVSVRWRAEGTQAGDLTGAPATHKRAHFTGQTIYEVQHNQLAGHWQVVDRLGFIQQRTAAIARELRAPTPRRQT